MLHRASLQTLLLPGHVLPAGGAHYLLANLIDKGDFLGKWNNKLLCFPAIAAENYLGIEQAAPHLHALC